MIKKGSMGRLHGVSEAGGPMAAQDREKFRRRPRKESTWSSGTKAKTEGESSCPSARSSAVCQTQVLLPTLVNEEYVFSTFYIIYVSLYYLIYPVIFIWSS